MNKELRSEEFSWLEYSPRIFADHTKIVTSEGLGSETKALLDPGASVNAISKDLFGRLEMTAYRGPSMVKVPGKGEVMSEGMTAFQIEVVNSFGIKAELVIATSIIYGLKPDLILG